MTKIQYCPACQYEIFYDLAKDYFCWGFDQIFCQCCYQTLFHYPQDLIKEGKYQLDEGETIDDFSDENDFVGWCHECYKQD